MIAALLSNEPCVVVSLSRGKSTIVDVADLHLLGTGKWYAHRNGKKFYAVSRRDGKDLYVHRMIIGTGYDFAGLSDHRNGDSLDNRRDNLRAATPSQNNTNIRSKVSKYGYRGIYKHRTGERPYFARVKTAGKLYYSAETFATAEDAARAYDKMALHHHGEFAVLNFPDELRSLSRKGGEREAK